MKHKNVIRLMFFVFFFIFIATLLIAVDPSYAGPGGLIKAAAKTFWGKVIMFFLVLFFLPLIIWYMITRWIQTNKTRKQLRKLALQVPHFEWIALKNRIHEVFMWVHSAWDQKKMDIAEDYMSPWYKQNQQLILDKWERDGVENIVSDVNIKELTPLYVYSDARHGDERIVVEITAAMRDYLVEKETGKVVSGDKTIGDVTTVWTFIREDNKWVLNMIESEDTVEDYLKEPNHIPQIVEEVSS